jgi:hypothetical protein
LKNAHQSLLVLLTVLSFTAAASFDEWQFKRRGNILARLSNYSNPSVPNYGQLTRASIEQTAVVSETTSFFNQLRWCSNSLSSDLSSKQSYDKNDSYQVLLGENYLKYKNENWITQIGNQEVVWGEAFGLNYADIINPKDLKETLFSDAADARIPLLLFNVKKLFNKGDLSGSVQFLYSPESRFSETLPVDLFIGSYFSQPHLIVDKAPNAELFQAQEMGSKISLSYAGFDTALFYYSYLDRDPSYTLLAASSNDLHLQEFHNRIKSTGASFAKTISDFVLRSDLVFTQDKSINYFDTTILKSYNTDLLNWLISLDSPSYNNYSGVIVFAQSEIKNQKLLMSRKKTEQYSIIKLSKLFNNDKSIDLSYVHEFQSIGNSIQAVFNWPLNNSIDLKIGTQTYFGNEQSNLYKYRKINSFFFSLKNYFEL